MNINQKIEEIRQKPEHIKIRYVWGGVAISMLFIITIWILSMKTSFQKIDSSEGQTLPDFRQSLEEINNIKDSTPSIQEMSGDFSENQEMTENQIPPEQNVPKLQSESVKGESSINEPNSNSNKEINNPLFPIE